MDADQKPGLYGHLSVSESQFKQIVQSLNKSSRQDFSVVSEMVCLTVLRSHFVNFVMKYVPDFLALLKLSKVLQDRPQNFGHSIPGNVGNCVDSPEFCIVVRSRPEDFQQRADDVCLNPLGGLPPI